MINRPGKFEGQQDYAPFFYHLWLSGDGDESYDDNGNFESVSFDLLSEDKDEYPQLADRDTVTFTQTESGFFMEVL